MPSCPRGTVDLIPGTIEIFQFMEQTARRVFSAYDYQEIRTPTFEDTALFVRGIGETTDIVSKEMYTFVTRGNQSLTLRPEGTAPVVRALIQHNLIKVRPVQKLYYIGPMYRYERPQAGRQRQFHQAGIEFFGVEGPEADAEVIVVMTRYLEALGFRGVRTKVNSLGTPEDRGVFNARLREYLGGRAGDLCEDCRVRLERNPLRVFDCKVPGCQAVLADAPKITEALGPDSKRHLDRTLELLALVGIDFEVAPRLVRGFDYYTKTVFETTLPGLGAQDAVLGGGRYDRLVEELGGPTTPATGAALGLERLALALQAAQLGPDAAASRPDIYLLVPDEEGLREAIHCCDLWRRAGLRVRWDAATRSFRSGMKAANNSAARFAAILGENERAKGCVALKNLATGEQIECRPEDVPGRVNGGACESVKV